MEEILFTLLAMIVCLIAEGFFSGSEMGVVSADRFRLRHEAAKGSKGAKLALNMLEKPEWLLSTTLVGTNISVVTNTTLATALAVNLFGSSYSWLAVVIVAPLIWIFGEIIPKSVFQQKANEITPKAIFIIKFCSYLFYPILFVFSLLTKLLAKLLGAGNHHSIFTLREQIISMLHLSEPQGDVSAEQNKMIRQMFQFSETKAVQTMIPLVNVIGINKSANCGETRELASATGYRNLLVYDQRVDNIIGMIHSLKLLGINPEEPLAPHISPVRYVSGSKMARELLDELRHSDDTIAVVVNEFGSASGIITATDIMQLIVFEYQDEFNRKGNVADLVNKISDKEYLVDANIDLRYLYDGLGIEVSKGNYSTLAGYLLQKFSDIPTQGSQIKSHDITYTIESATERKLEKIRVQLP